MPTSTSTPVPAATPISAPTFAPRPTPAPTDTPTLAPTATATPIPSPTPSPTPVIAPIIWKKPDKPAACAADTYYKRVTFGEGGKLSGTYYRPQGQGPFPAVLVLHTRGGLKSHEMSTASWLASQGYVALAPDYFAPLGLTAKTFDLDTFFVQYSDESREVMAEALECLKSLSYVDGNRLGTVGFSLGGYFGFILASRDDIKGVVSSYGAYHGAPISRRPAKYSWPDIVSQVQAPVLMLHGDQDTTIPISWATKVRDLLTQAGKSFELIVFPSAEHAFDKVGQPTYNAAVREDARAKTLEFLGNNLK